MRWLFFGLVIIEGERVREKTKVFPDAPIGAIKDDFHRYIGYGFPDGTTLESGHLYSYGTSGLDPDMSTRIIIANETFMTPLDRYSSGKLGWYDNSPHGFNMGTAGFAHFQIKGVYLTLQRYIVK